MDEKNKPINTQESKPVESKPVDDKPKVIPTDTGWFGCPDTGGKEVFIHVSGMSISQGRYANQVDIVMPAGQKHSVPFKTPREVYEEMVKKGV